VESEKQYRAVTAQEEKPRGSENVLVVDDDGFILRLTERLLGMLGFNSLLAESGVEALDVFRQYKRDISCIILDLSMPEMSGAELAKKIWQLNPEAKIIVCSGVGEREARRHFNDSDKVGFLKKPFKPVDLEIVMRKLLAG